MNLGRRAGRPHQNNVLPGLQRRAQVGAAAHFQRDNGNQAALLVGPGAGHREALHRKEGRRKPRLLKPLGRHFIVLQAVELAGAEGARGGRRLQNDFHDGRRQPVHRVDARLQFVAAAGDDAGAGRRSSRLSPASTWLTTG